MQVSTSVPIALLPAVVIRWQSFMAAEGQQTFTVTEAVAAFVMVFCGESPLFEVDGSFSVDGRSIALAEPAQPGEIIMVGYRPIII